ncbi:MAG TPA: alpha-1,4-glucan--maltose-1-phosphate maltosyltransferase [Acidimicrobiales bacterium]|nr:alpha-1,4-glucan--maltose-1-phosphate maltosyltransferase [Acidimicrobiales bacterium]
MLGRIVIDGVRPSTPNGYPAKAVVGEAVTVGADIFKDGHDTLAARVRWRAAGGDWQVADLHEVGNDRWEGVISPAELGPHELVVEAWTDRYATWRHKTTTKLAAGQDVDLELEEGAQLLEARAAKLRRKADKERLTKAVVQLRSAGAPPPERLAPALDQSAARAMAGPEGATDLTAASARPLWVDRPRALRGAWYELFPRSEGGFKGAAERLAAVADMGFDVVYLPPIHPIGRTFRKGRNNTLVAEEDAPGSPWAIGSEEGGHTAIHPDLGTEADFEAFVERAGELGMEVALDYALQCSPDHPWVRDHPEWFHLRPDGTIAYAENPPKRYQDIYPINFWPVREEDREALWEACRQILIHWMDRGVRIFRVDNPHTKPMAFWEWLIPSIQATDPDIVFLAEAFTRPKVMAKLAEVGFSQSYTYFTWRNTAEELRQYLTELAHGPTADYMRPNFWPNTPDILSGPLRNGPLSAFRMRLVLAATMTPAYGIYSGFELGENEPASDQNEEYLNSEKYEVKHRDWDRAASLAPWITRVNDIRRRHRAFDSLRNIVFHHSANPALLAYSKHTDDRSDVVLTVVNLDPSNVQETVLWVDLGVLGIPWDQPYEAYDEMTGQSFTWQGPEPYVRLDPEDQPAHVLHLRRL